MFESAPHAFPAGPAPVRVPVFPVSRGLVSGARRWGGPSLSLLAGGLLLAAPVPLWGQTAAQVMSEAMAAHTQRLAGVDNLMIQQEIMGFGTTTWMAKELVDGRPVLTVHSVEVGGLSGISPTDAGGEFLMDPGQMFEEWGDRWTLEGQGSIGGQDTWRLFLDRFDGIDWAGAVPGENVAMNPERMVLELEAARLVPLLVSVDGTVTEGGEERPVAMTLRFSDYREVDGFLHPYLTEVEADLAAAGVSEADREQARQGLEEMRRQLEQAPAAQREMLERMLGGQLETLERMLGGDSVTLELRVTELRVNAGLP